MKKFTFKIALKIVALFICLIGFSKGFAQLSSNLTPDKIMKPEFLQTEKKRIPIRFGLGIETYASGNAHGAYYSARLNISKGKSTFSLGPCLQKRSLEINGVKATYSYLLSGINDRYDEDELNEMKDDPCDILELRMLCCFQYLNKAPLSYKASRVETITNNESKVNFNQVRLSTIEASLCIELDVNVNCFKIRAYVGTTTFYHTDYINGMYRPKFSPALMFGTGIIIPHL